MKNSYYAVFVTLSLIALVGAISDFSSLILPIIFCALLGLIMILALGGVPFLKKTQKNSEVMLLVRDLKGHGGYSGNQIGQLSHSVR